MEIVFNLSTSVRALWSVLLYADRHYRLILGIFRYKKKLRHTTIICYSPVGFYVVYTNIFIFPTVSIYYLKKLRTRVYYYLRYYIIIYYYLICTFVIIYE